MLLPPRPQPFSPPAAKLTTRNGCIRFGLGATFGAESFGGESGKTYGTRSLSSLFSSLPPAESPAREGKEDSGGSTVFYCFLPLFRFPG